MSLGMEAWKLGSRNIQDRFPVHVEIRRREMIYIVHGVVEMEVANATVGQAGESSAWWGSRSRK